jgi:hypothetical protein
VKLTSPDATLPVSCPNCEHVYQWHLSPAVMRMWVNCLLAHLAGMRTIDGRVFDTKGGSDGGSS